MGKLIGEIPPKNVQNYDKNVNFLRYSNHVWYVNNINARLKTFWFTICDTFLSKTGNLERRLDTCNER